MENAELIEKVAHLEEKAKSNIKRLDEHDKDIDELKKTYSIMEKMDYRMSNVEKGLDNINAKLDKHDVEIQEEMNKDINIKSKKWDKLIDYIFYFFIAAILRNNSCKNWITIGRRRETMDISVLTQYVSIVVVGICLCVGYIIKNSLDFIPNKYIPLIMGVLGLTLNILINLSSGINAEVILGGLLSGLASTGMYEMFKNLINKE